MMIRGTRGKNEGTKKKEGKRKKKRRRRRLDPKFIKITRKRRFSLMRDFIPFTIASNRVCNWD